MKKKPIIEIDCFEVWRHISDYVDQVVDPKLRAVMAAHFQGCAHCSAILDGTRNVVKLVADGKSFELPRAASERLYLKLDQHLEQKPRRRGK